MAAANISPINYVGIQASEFTILPTIRATSFAGLVQIHEDVKYRKQLALLRSGKFAYRTETNAAKTATGGGVTGSEVWIEVDRIYSQESQVTADYFEKFLIEAARNGVDSGDLQGVAAAEQIVALYSQDRGVDLERLLWGGLSTAVAGNFTTTPDATAAVKAAFYSTVTGFIPRIMAKIATGDIEQPVLIASSPTAANVIGYFRSLYNAQSAELLGYLPGDKVHVCTRNIYNLFLTDRESFTGSDFSFQLQNDGTEIIRFRGIEIVNPNVVNLMQQEKSWGDYLPTSFLFLMSRDALALGADAYSPEASVKTWYSDDDDVNYIRSKAAIGTQIVADYMIVAATSTEVPSASASGS